MAEVGTQFGMQLMASLRAVLACLTDTHPDDWVPTRVHAYQMEGDNSLPGPGVEWLNGPNDLFAEAATIRAAVHIQVGSPAWGVKNFMFRIDENLDEVRKRIKEMKSDA